MIYSHADNPTEHSDDEMILHALKVTLNGVEKQHARNVKRGKTHFANVAQGRIDQLTRLIAERGG